MGEKRFCELSGRGVKYPLNYKNDREIFGLQILKFICALLVVQIHVYSGLKDILIPIARIGVPVFFLITGYFIPDSTGVIKKEKLKRTFSKILKIELVAIVIYLFYRIYINYSFHPEQLQEMLTVKYWMIAFGFGEHPAGHLWYLVALLQAVLVIWVCVELDIVKWLYWLIPIGLILSLLFGRYNFLIFNLNIPQNILLSRNFLTTALPCILLGTLIRYYEHLLPSQSKMALITVCFLFGVYVETAILTSIFPDGEGDIVIMTIPLATAVFVIFLRISVTGKIGLTLAGLGRAYSLDIYLWHVVLGTLGLGVLKWIGFRTTDWFDAFIVMAIAVIFAIVSRSIGLRKLYSQ